MFYTGLAHAEQDAEPIWFGFLEPIRVLKQIWVSWSNFQFCLCQLSNQFGPFYPIRAFWRECGFSGISLGLVHTNLSLLERISAFIELSCVFESQFSSFRSQFGHGLGVSGRFCSLKSIWGFWHVLGLDFIWPVASFFVDPEKSLKARTEQMAGSKTEQNL